jgi:hypothetical protein
MFRKILATAAVAMIVGVGTATASETPQGLRADGLRLQAMAHHYKSLHGYTPAGLYADGLRWQSMARFYESQGHRAVANVSSTRTGFAWGDAGIGAATGLAACAAGAVALVFARRSRRTKLAH